MADAAWAGGDYTEQPEKGLRAAAAALEIWVRHWDWMDKEFPDNQQVVGWLNEQTAETAKLWDANNFIYQTRAEDLHDIAQGGDYAAALRKIEARTLLLPGTHDLLHPAADSRFAAKHIPKALWSRSTSIRDTWPAVSSKTDIDFVNATIARFLHEVFSDLVKI